MKVINRIRASEDFALTIKKGKAFYSDSYTVHVANNEIGHTRIGISVSAKLCNAVNRNRIKRQIRAMCDSLINYDETALDVVIIARKGFLEKSFEENKANLSDLLNNR